MEVGREEEGLGGVEGRSFRYLGGLRVRLTTGELRAPGTGPPSGVAPTMTASSVRP
jgi:hypothetical protein